MYARYVLRLTMNAHYARAGRLEGGGGGEVSAAYGGATERLVGLADQHGISSVVRRKAA
jgi:hypothetical protein